jgi:hypothetical protein
MANKVLRYESKLNVGNTMDPKGKETIESENKGGRERKRKKGNKKRKKKKEKNVLLPIPIELWSQL